jgi:hypothetical protein
MAIAKTLEAAMQEALAARGQSASPKFAAPMAGPTGDADLRNAISAPADPTHYQIPVPAGFERDVALEAKARGWFHRAGLPQGAVNGIVDAYCRQLCSDPAGDIAPQARSELMRDWGPDYLRKIAAAQSLIAKCGGAEELAEIFGATGLGNDTWLIRTLAAIAEMDPNEGATR